MTSNNERGTEQSPIFVQVLPPTKTNDEASKRKTQELGQSSTDWWMVWLTGAIVFIGALQTVVFGIQASRLKQTIKKMDEIATAQTSDVRASILEATRAATAMEGVAGSLAESTQAVQKSLIITREMVDTQKFVFTLQNRAYLSAAFNSAIFQDANHVFEVQISLLNRGNTPAYDVTFKATAEIVPVPLPDDFGFPLPDSSAGISVSLIAPGTTKLINRRVSGRVPDNEVDAIKSGGPPHGLVMWGIVRYRDVFNEIRHLRFAFLATWMPWIKGMGKDKDGNPLPEQTMGYDTAHHNDSD